jgi:hypothetical protein
VGEIFHLFDEKQQAGGTKSKKSIIEAACLLDR